MGLPYFYGGLKEVEMSIPKPEDRPDYSYWMQPWQTRNRPDRSELEVIKQKLAEYSALRFVLGRRFRLRKEFQSVPKGTCCTVTRLWPDVRVRWDKWAQKGAGAERVERCVSFEMDLELEDV